MPDDLLHFIMDTHPWLLRVVAFYMGACIGSFLNVCILRIPAGRSIVTPRSHCVCGQLIAWYDNIPILSWFILRGRARCCGQKFSIRYSLIEALTAGVYLWLWMALPPATAVAGMVFFSLLLLGAMIDLDCLQLPDVTTIGGLLAGLALSLLWPQIHGLPGGTWHWAVAQKSGLVALTGAVAGAGFIYWIGELGGFFLRKPAMGYGDMLLMGCIGAFCGWRGALASLFIGTFAGLFAIILLTGLASLRRGKKSPNQEPPPPEEASVPTELEVNPLGRRVFAVGFLFLAVLIAALHGLVWMWHNGGALLIWPGAIYLGVILFLALLKRSRFTLSEPWLVLAVFVGVILSAIFPRMQGIASTEIWFVNAIRGGVAAIIAAIIGAGLALWVMEFANLTRHYFFPNAPAGPALDDYHQIAGEGYLLLFGSIGALCGWPTAAVAVATFAVLGAIQMAASLWRKPSASTSAAATAQENASSTADALAPTDTAAASPSTWTFGQEIPFGPSLALGGFLYYAWPWLHLGVDRYVLLVRDTFFGN